MSTFLDLTAANPALKEYYDDQKVQNLVYEENPLLAMLPKDTAAGGKYIPVPVIYELNQGRSATFSNAQGNQTPALLAEFLLTRKSDYDVATIDNQTLEAAATDKMSFMRTSTLLIDAAIRGASLSAAVSAFRSGTGSRGTIATGGITSGVITLTNAADVVNFGVNQTLQVAATDGGTARAALGYVIARSVAAGTITVASSALGGSAASPTSWTAGDFLFVQGDSNNMMSGLSAWLPATAPTSSDNFYGVNRSTDSRLYGLYYDGSAQPIEEALVDHSMLVAREGSSIDTEVMNFGSYAALIKALGSKVQYIDMKGPAEIAFEGIKLHGAKRIINVFPDRNCQPQAGFALKMNTWKLYSLGDVPKILRYTDGNDMLRVYNADAAECRVAYYANLGCNAPGWNGQTKFGV